MIELTIGSVINGFRVVRSGEVKHGVQRALKALRRIAGQSGD